MTIKQRRWVMACFAITLNALGNAMVAHSHLGNTYWGVAAENITALANIQFGTSILIITLILFIYNRIALKEYRLLLDTLSLIVTISFGVLINIFSEILAANIDLTNNVILANIVWALGIILMTMSISMYIKPNLIIPAFDENMSVIAKLYCKGNLVKAGYIAMIVAMTTTLIVGIINDMTFYGLNIYSLIVIITFGPLVNLFYKHNKLYDKYIQFGEYEK